MGARIINRLDASHGEGNAISESVTGTNAAKNLDDSDQARTPRHVRGLGGLKVFNNI